MERAHQTIDEDGSRNDDRPVSTRRASTPTIRMRVWQARTGDAPCEPRIVSLEPGRSSHVACENPACRGGGLDPLPVVRDLVESGAEELRVFACEGRVAINGDRRGARCDTMFCVSLAATRP